MLESKKKIKIKYYDIYVKYRALYRIVKKRKYFKGLFENKKEFLELLSYGSHVESQISYDRKNAYHSLIAEYLALLNLDRNS